MVFPLCYNQIQSYLNNKRERSGSNSFHLVKFISNSWTSKGSCNLSTKVAVRVWCGVSCVAVPALQKSVSAKISSPFLVNNFRKPHKLNTYFHTSFWCLRKDLRKSLTWFWLSCSYVKCTSWKGLVSVKNLSWLFFPYQGLGWDLEGRKIAIIVIIAFFLTSVFHVCRDKRFLINEFQEFLSLVRILMSFFSFRSFLITSFHVFFAHPLGKLPRT